jgi:hypothetical protein
MITIAFFGFMALSCRTAIETCNYLFRDKP